MLSPHQDAVAAAIYILIVFITVSVYTHTHTHLITTIAVPKLKEGLEEVGGEYGGGMTTVEHIQNFILNCAQTSHCYYHNMIRSPAFILMEERRIALDDSDKH
jgi:hypothetical protein